MAKTVDKSTLGYLGQEFQFKLVKCLIEDQKFFVNIQHILDQNMFTDENLRRIVGFMKDRYNFTESVATYSELTIIIRSKILDAVTVELVIATLEKIRAYDLSGIDIIQEEAERFFKQQNLTRAINKAQEIIKKGDGSNYYQIEDLVKKALEVNTKQDFGWRLFENIESDLSETYRITIPTGADKLDEALYGGLGKGELGIVIAPLGTGKAQPLTSRVLTANGYKTMGEIKINDYVIGGDGKAHRVLATFPQGIRPVYKVEFSNGRSCECDINHLWNVKLKKKNDFGDVQTLSLQDIINNGLRYKNNDGSNGKYKYYIPNVSPVEFTFQHVDIEPYIFGYCISDGFNTLNHFMDCDLKVYKDETKNMNYTSCFIPDKYLYNTFERRLALLQGLMDAKGFVTKKGNIIYNTMCLSLAKNVKFLVRSMGGNASIKNVIKKGKKVYCVYITFETDIIPFTLTKKVELCKQYPNKFQQAYIKNVEYVRDEETKCILVDSEEHTYVTEDFIVTHNTSCTTGFAAAAAIAKTESNDFSGFKVLHFYFEDDDANIRRKYYGYVTDIDACDLSKPEYRPIAIKRLNEDSDIRKMLHENIMGERLSTGEVTASEIKRKIKSYIARGFKPDLVIVDYFECIKPEKSDDMNSSEWSREGISMRKLESTAKELNVAIWVPVQGTKDSIGAEIVGVNQAGGSVKKTQIGHVVITLAQTQEQKVQGKLNMFIGKLRAARIGRNKFMNIGFNNGTLKFDMSNCDEDDDFDKIENTNSRQNQLAKEIRDYERRKRQI